MTTKHAPLIERTLDAMSRRGLYDHLRGGFARYSVDAEWHVPHFEKMLSDQALLARTYLRAARALPAHREWRDVALDTIEFVVTDLAVASGFASALDADAGGVEGSHVTWTPSRSRRRTRTRRPRRGRRRPHCDDGESKSPAPSRAVRFLGSPTVEPFVTPARARMRLAPVAAPSARRTRPAEPRREGDPRMERDVRVGALRESATLATSARGIALLESLRRTHFDGDVWWRTEGRRAHASAGDVAWMLDACVDAFEATGDDRVARTGPARSRGTCSSTTGTARCRRRATRTPAAASSREATSSPTSTPSPRRSSTAPRRRVTPSPVARSRDWRWCTGDDEILVVAQRLVELAASLLATHPGAVPDLLDAAGFALSGVEVVVPGRRERAARVRRFALHPGVAVLVTGDRSRRRCWTTAGLASPTSVAPASVSCRRSPSRRSTSSCVTWEPDADLHARPRRPRQQAPRRTHAPTRHRRADRVAPPSTDSCSGRRTRRRRSST